MPDVKVNLNDRATGHLDYDVPATAEFLLKQAFASYDGVSAASAWLPALQLIGPDGNIAGSYVTGSTVAAGGSADVTFGPFLRGATTGSTPVTSGGLPNAVMRKSLAQTVAGNHITQLTLDSGTFATTDGTIFSASGSNIAIAAPGLYAAYVDMVNDVTDEDPAQTQLYPKWLQTGGGANAPWEQIVPRIYNVNGPAGLQGFMPDGAGLSQNIDNFSVAYCNGPGTKVGAWLATLSATAVTTSTVLLVVVQLQPISAADLAFFPSYPF